MNPRNRQKDLCWWVNPDALDSYVFVVLVTLIFVILLCYCLRQVYYIDSDMGDEPKTFRDVFLHSQALEGITLSMVS